MRPFEVTPQLEPDGSQATPQTAFEELKQQLDPEGAVSFSRERACPVTLPRQVSQQQSDKQDQEQTKSFLSTYFSGFDSDYVNRTICDAARLIKKLHLPSLAAYARLFIDTDKPSKKLALLSSIVGVFVEAPICLTLAENSTILNDIGPLFKLLLEEDTKQPQVDDTVPHGKLLDAFFSRSADTVTIDLSKSLKDQHTESSMIGDLLEKHQDLIRPGFALIGLIAAACGMHQLIEVDFTKKLLEDFFSLSKAIFSLKTSWKAVTEIVDPLMEVVFGFFGKDYIRPEHRSIMELSQKIQDLQNEVVDIMNRVKTDFFGFRLETATSIERRYQELVKAFAMLQTEQKSMYNFNTRMSDIQSRITAINEIAIDKYKSKAGKQRPVTFWISGTPNAGKTYLAEKMAIRVAKHLGTDVYARTVSDEFWSSYQGQGVTTMDDMKQRKDDKDTVEFHRYTSEDQKDVIGAGLTDKGRPFVSQVIVVTSNFMWFAPPSQINDMLALNRRRDICVYAFNPEVAAYADSHRGAYPEDQEFFKKHPTQYYLIDPTYGYKFGKSANSDAYKKFFPSAPYVIREVTEDEVFNCITALERKRAEAFRQKIIRVGEHKYPIPQEPFTWNEEHIFTSQMDSQPSNIMIDEESCSSAHQDINRMRLVFKDGVSTQEHIMPRSLVWRMASKYFGEDVNERNFEKYDFWFAQDGNLIQHSNRSYNSTQLELYVLRDEIAKAPEPVFMTSSKHLTCELYVYKREDDTDPQSNPLTKIVTEKVCYGLLIKGPPKTGKSHVIKTRFADEYYKVLYTKGEKYPQDKIIWFDDITNSFDRIQKFKECIGDFHDGNMHDLKYVVCTLNNNSEVWTSLPLDDRNMIERRCHVIETDYTLATKACLLVKSLDSVIRTDNFKDCVTGEVHIKPGRDEGLYDLTDPQQAIHQVISIESVASVVAKHRVFKRGVKIPRPKKVPLIVTVPSDTVPDPEGTSFLKLREDGRYTPLSLVEKTALAFKFTLVVKKLAAVQIADRTEAAFTINSMQIPNTTGVTDWLICAPSFELYVTTVDGYIVCLEVDQSKTYDYEYGTQGFFFEGVYYLYDDIFDQEVSYVLAKVAQLDANFAAPTFVPEKPEDFTKQTKPGKLITSIAATIDIVMEVASAFSIILPENEKNLEDALKTTFPESQEEGRPARRPAPKTAKADPADGSTAGKQRQQQTKSFESEEPKEDKAQASIEPEGRPARRPAVAKRGHSSAASDSSGDKQRASKPVYESDDSDHWTYLVQIPYDEDHYSYGIVYQDQLYEFKELRANRWTLFARPAPRNLIQLDKKHLVSRTFLNKSVGQHVDSSFDEELCVDSIFSTYVMEGKYIDLDSKRELTEEQGKKLFPWGISKPVATRTQAAFEDTQIEGSQDPAAFELAVELTHSQAEMVVPGGDRELWALMLSGNEGITNAHSKADTIRYQGKEWPIETVAVSHDADLRLFKVTDKKFPSVKNIKNKIVTSKELNEYLSITDGKCALLVPLRAHDVNNTPYLQVGEASTLSRAVSSVDQHGVIKYRLKAGLFGYTGLTKRGDCGTPVLLIAPRVTRKVCGLHFRGAQDISLATIITQELLKDLHTVKESDNTIVHSVPNRDILYADTVYQDEQTGCTVVGTPKERVHVPTTTTKFKTGLDIPTQFEPSIKSRKDPRNIEQRDVLAEGMANYGKPAVEDVPEQLIRETADEIGLYLGALMSSKGMTTRMLTFTEAINGPPVDEFPTSKAIDRTGSVGYPYVQRNPTRTTKGDYLVQNQENFLWYFAKDQASQGILAEANAVYAQATRGVHVSMPWTAYPKDEPVKLKKIYDASQMKTRVFFSGTFSYQLAYRRAFYAAIARITELHLDVPVRVGIRQMSLEWVALAYQHVRVSPMGFASDMKNWDGCIPMPFLQAMPIIFNRIYQLTDPAWTKEDDITRRALHKNVEGATIIIRDKVVKLDHALASGFPGTAVENSLINWLLFACCFKLLAKKHAPHLATFEKFMELVCLSVFGDDNLVTVADVIAAWFHFNSFKEMARSFGFTVTDAAKTGEDQPDLQPLEELEFLKRSFKKNTWCWLPALDKASINKQLTWIAGHGSYEFKGIWPTAPNNAVFEDSLRALWPEIAMHGKEYFDSVQREIIRAAHGTNIMVTPPTFETAFNATGFGDY